MPSQFVKPSSRTSTRTQQIELTAERAERLRLFGIFANAKPTDILSVAFDRLCEQDEDFAPWCKENADNYPVKKRGGVRARTPKAAEKVA